MRLSEVVYAHISPLLTTRDSRSLVVRASVLDLGGSWVHIPSGALIFSKFPKDAISFMYNFIFGERIKKSEFQINSVMKVLVQTSTHKFASSNRQKILHVIFSIIMNWILHVIFSIIMNWMKFSTHQTRQVIHDLHLPDRLHTCIAEWASAK